MMKCQHPQIRVRAEPVNVLDVGTVFLKASMECAVCSMKFAFVGVQRDALGSPAGPTATPDGVEVNLPMVEIGERLAS